MCLTEQGNIHNFACFVQSKLTLESIEVVSSIQITAADPAAAAETELHTHIVLYLF